MCRAENSETRSIHCRTRAVASDKNLHENTVINTPFFCIYYELKETNVHQKGHLIFIFVCLFLHKKSAIVFISCELSKNTEFSCGSKLYIYIFTGRSCQNIKHESILTVMFEGTRDMSGLL